MTHRGSPAAERRPLRHRAVQDCAKLLSRTFWKFFKALYGTVQQSAPTHLLCGSGHIWSLLTLPLVSVASRRPDGDIKRLWSLSPCLSYFKKCQALQSVTISLPLTCGTQRTTEPESCCTGMSTSSSQNVVQAGLLRR